MGGGKAVALDVLCNQFEHLLLSSGKWFHGAA